MGAGFQKALFFRRGWKQMVHHGKGARRVLASSCIPFQEAGNDLKLAVHAPSLGACNACKTLARGVFILKR